MLTTLKRDLEREAQLAPEYTRDERTTDMIETFANKYCEAVDSGDQRNSSIYLSCLLLKFWNRITDIYAGKDKHYGDQISFLVSNGQITIEAHYCSSLHQPNHLVSSSWRIIETFQLEEE